jgi:hypothetical protein
MVWLMIISLVFGLIGVGWSAFRVNQVETIEAKPTPVTCDDLRNLIIAEEEVSFNNWKSFHKKVVRYSQGVSRSERSELVSQIAADVRIVLTSDLLLYKQMRKSPQCLTVQFREEVSDWITETKDMIAAIDGESEPEKPFFNIEEGYWDTSFYDKFYSATDFLVTGLTNI